MPFAIVFIFSFAASAQLKGVYTINPNKAAGATNYQNFASAVGDLVSGTRTDGGTANGKGIDSVVVFRIANGIYHEKIYLPKIKGSSKKNRIIFLSDTGNSKFVTIDVPSETQDTGKKITSNYAIYFDTASYITFEYLTIKRSGNHDFGNVIMMQSDTGIQLIHNIIRGTGAYPYYSFESECIQELSCQNTLINSNSISHGTIGIDFSVGTTFAPVGNIISANKIDSCYHLGINYYSQAKGSITNNIITNITDNQDGNSAGIIVSSCGDSVYVTNNTLVLPMANYGISASSNGSLVKFGTQIYNNSIVIGKSNTKSLCYGVWLSSNSYCNFIFNSINVLTPASLSAGTYFSSNTNSRLYNNVVVNSGGGLAFQSTSSSIDLGYNDFYTTGSYIGIINGTEYATLKNYQTGCSCAYTTISVNPYYKSSTDLHALNTYLSIRGFYFSFVKTDLDNALRSTKNASMGAYSITQYETDPALLSIQSPDVHFCAGQYNATVSLLNEGYDTLKSDSFYYQINSGTPEVFKYTGNLLWGQDTVLTIGKDSLAPGQNYLYKIWSTAPNDTFDQNRNNDTITRLVYEGLKGNYTIGGTSPDYPTITAAIEDLEYRGVCAPVVLKIRDGIYKEQLTVLSIPNTSTTNTVTFESESGDSTKVNIQWPSSADTTRNYTLGLFGTSNVIFKQLHFERTDVQKYNNIVFLAGGSSEISFLSNHVIGTKTLVPSSSVPPCILFYSDYGTDSNNVFKNNYLRYGLEGFYLKGYDSLHQSKNNVFQYNIFDSVLSTGVALLYNTNAKIASNIFKHLTGGAIGLQSCISFIVSGNNIQMPTGVGISISSSFSKHTNPALVYNNFILLTDYNTSGGIFCDGRYINVFNNTVSVPRSQSAYCINVDQNQYKPGTNYGINVENNIFVSVGGHPVAYYNLYAIDTVDHNNYYTSSTVLLGSNVVSQYNTANTSYNNLKAWQTATGNDLHSIFVDPWFKSPTDLHVSNPLLYHKGKYFSYIPIDIDGQKRDTVAPVLGADEFTAYPNDAGITGFNTSDTVFCAGSLPLITTLTNFGTDTLKRVVVDWTMNGSLQPQSYWSGLLAPGYRINDTLGNFSFQSKVNYLKRAWSEKPNGTIDGNFSNDTSIITSMTEGLHGTYTIGGSNPDYKTFTEASNALKLRGVCGPVVFNVRDGVYEEQVFLGAVLNASKINNIVFQSESGDSSKVILTYSADAVQVYRCTMQFYSASFYIIKGITIQKTGTNNQNGTVLDIEAVSNNNLVTNCRITTSVYGGSTIGALINSTDGRDSGTTFIHNYFYGAGYGIFLATHALSVISNIFDSVDIYISHAANDKIIGNIIHPQISNGTDLGIYASAGSGKIIISQNKIYIGPGGTGIYLNKGVGKRGNPSSITDNYIYCYGDYCHPFTSELSFCDIMYNTIRYENHAAGDYFINFYMDSAHSVRFTNNCIVNDGPMTTFFYASPINIFSQCNYNSYYTQGTYFGGTDYYNRATDFENWKNLMHADSNSVYSYPIFTDVQGHTHSASLAGRAKPNYVLTDNENNTRSTTTPDIGAYEFTPDSTDFAVMALISPATNACGDSNTYFQIAAINNGAKALTSIPIVVEITGSIDTVLHDTIQGPIAAGSNDTLLLKIPLNTYSGANINYKIYSRLPGEQDRTNDTISGQLQLNKTTVKPNVKGATICGTSTPTLYANAPVGTKLFWYPNATTDKPIAFGDSMVTPALKTAATFYVESRVSQQKASIGATKDTIGDKYPGYTLNEGIYFDALTDLSIDSITVFPAQSGLVVISILDRWNNVLTVDSERVTVTYAGKKTILPVFLRVPKGTGYSISANGSAMNLYTSDLFNKNFTGYPIVVQNVITLTRADYSAFYFFYNWKITTLGCGGSRMPVNVIFKSGMSGAGFSKGTNFSGKYNAGTAADPHNICTYTTSEFNIVPPTGYSDSTYGTNWKATFTVTTTHGNLFYDTSFVKPGTSHGILKINPRSMADSTILVSCTITNLHSHCDTTIQMYVFINPVPLASYTYSINCLGRKTAFTSNATGNPNTIYLWNFGDTTYSSVANPTHAFAKTATYSVKLVTKNTAGCGDSVSKSIAIYPKPTAAFGAPASCLGSAVPFYDSSTISSGSISSHVWYFGDGYSSTASSVTHKYMYGGNYQGELIVKSNNGCTDTTKRTIVIYPTPYIKFSINQTCAGLPVIFNNQTTFSAGTTTYKWKFGDGTTSTDSSPTHTYKTAGNYNVYLITYSSFGCKDSNSIYETMNPNPVASFTNSATCANTPVTFTNGSKIASGSMTYSWRFGDSSVSTTQSPSHTYSKTGAYKILLTTTSNYGCTDTISKTIVMANKPVASYTINSSKSQCLNGNGFQFSDSSTVASGSISSWSWNFADGNSSTSQDPLYSYKKAGNYRVKLTVTSGTGCSDTISKPVSAFPQAAISFTINQNSACLPNNIFSFTDKSTITSGSILSRKWDFGDSSSSTSQNPTHSYLKTGSFKVLLTTTTNNGCVDTLSKFIQVYPVPTASFTVNSAAECLNGNSFVFGDKSSIPSGSISTWNWDFADGTKSTSQNPTYAYKKAGTYKVILTVKNAGGCSDTISKTIVVYPQSVPSFSVNQLSACLPNNDFSFTDKSSISSGSISSWAWDFGDTTTSNSQSPAHAYNHTGAYKVLLTTTSNNGCIDTVSKQVHVYPVPSDSFSVNSITQCLGNNKFAFTDKSAVSSGSISTWAWAFGDGNKSSAQNPTYSYTNSGVYKVLLTVTSNGGCTDTFSKSVTILPKSNPAFSVNQQSSCLSNNSFDFTDKSTISLGSITSWQWDFGDNTKSSDKNQTHSYQAPGSYKVVLSVTNNIGCTDTISRTIVVHPMPVTTFSVNSATQCMRGNSFSFADKSTISTGSIASWSWKFGDSSVSTSQNPTHAFAAAGQYKVSLTALSDYGCKDTVSGIVVINVSPFDSFTINSRSQCLSSNSFNFRDKSSIGSGSISSWKWDFGDGTTSTDQNPDNAYVKSGKYIVMLTLTSDKGCTQQCKDSVNVNSSPTVDFSAKNGCENDSFIFNNSSKISSGAIASYSWTFGDGSTSNIENPSHLFSKNGNDTIKLICTSVAGCSDSTLKIITIYPVPTAIFSVNNTCNNDSVKYVNNSTISPGGIAYSWNFGDGANSNNTDPGHIYSLPGNYRIILKASSSAGCIDTISHSIIIYPTPSSKFKLISGCLKDTLNFSNTSTIKNGSMTYKWDFGDGSSSANNNPSHLYSVDKTYQVKLVAKSNEGCLDSSYQNITVYPSPVVDFSVSRTCLGDSSDFLNKSSVTSKTNTYKWNFGDGSVSNDENPTHLYGSDGTFQVYFKVATSQGCADSSEKRIDILPIPNAGFSVSNECAGLAAIFKDSSTSQKPITKYKWSFGDGHTDTVKNPLHSFNDTGVYKVTEMITSGNGCTDSFDKNIKIISKPDAAWTFSVSDYTASFIPSDSTLFSYNWSLGDGHLSGAKKPVYAYAANGAYNVKLIVSNGICEDSSEQTVNIKVHTNAVSPYTIANHLNIYPNPFKDEFMLGFNLNTATEVNIEISDMHGKLVKYINQGYLQAGNYSISIDLADNALAPGTYMIKMLDSKGVTVRQLIKTH